MFDQTEASSQGGPLMRWIATFVAASVCFTASAVGAVTEPALGQTVSRSADRHMAWAIVLCRLKGDYAQQRTNQYYEELFTEAGIGMQGVYDFYLDSSQGRFSLEGSKVFGPFEVPMTPAQEYAAAQAEAGKPGLLPARLWRIRNCIDAADGAVDFSGFAGIVAVYNSGTEGGAHRSTLTLDGTTREWPLVILDPGSVNVSFAAHEIGHGIFGLVHTRSVKDPNKDYGDPYDTMSYPTGNEYPHAHFVAAKMPLVYDTTYKKKRWDWSMSPSSWQWIYRAAGPSLAVPWRFGKGWLDGGSMATIDPTRCRSTIKLAAVNAREGVVAARIPVSSERTVFVEFRSRSGWDLGLKRDTVLIHELRSSGPEPWLVDAPDPEWLPGEIYEDPSGLRIRIDSIDQKGRTANVTVLSRNASLAEPMEPAAPVAQTLAGVALRSAVPMGNLLADLLQGCPPRLIDPVPIVPVEDFPPPLPDPTEFLKRAPIPPPLT